MSVDVGESEHGGGQALVRIDADLVLLAVGPDGPAELLDFAEAVGGQAEGLGGDGGLDAEPFLVGDLAAEADVFVGEGLAAAVAEEFAEIVGPPAGLEGGEEEGLVGTEEGGERAGDRGKVGAEEGGGSAQIVRAGRLRASTSPRMSRRSPRCPLRRILRA